MHRFRAYVEVVQVFQSFFPRLFFWGVAMVESLDSLVEVWGKRRLGFHEAMSGDAIKMGEAIGAQTIDLEWVQARFPALM